MRVFVSSVIHGYEDYRRAAKVAIEALDHEPVGFGITHTSAAHSPKAVLLGDVEHSDVVVLLLGGRYGDRQESGKSATVEEYEHAQVLRKPVLVFVERVDHRDPDQQAFLDELSGWDDGLLWTPYSDPIDLSEQVAKALKRHATEAPPPAPEALMQRLPPTCRTRIETLQESSPDAANQLVQLLSDPDSRRAGVLSQLAVAPVGWMAEASYLVWEAIGEFIDAHMLGDSSMVRQQAIDAGSPRKPLHLIRQAESLAEQGDRDRAENLISCVPADHPLLPAVRALIDNDWSSAAEAITSVGLHEAEDPELARCAIARLVRAYDNLDRLDLAIEILRDANRRFPGHAWLMFHQAGRTLDIVEPTFLGSEQSNNLLTEAAELAVGSRDLFRAWNGPSHLAVDVAAQAYLGLQDPQRAADVGRLQPDGEATKPEAATPEVRRTMAHALLMLDRASEVDLIRLDGIEDAEAALIRAMQSSSLDDAAALSRMRNALARAADEPTRRRALFGIALLGEIDEGALTEVPEAAVALLRGVAALHNGNAAEARATLLPYRIESPTHAYYLAQAQHRDGDTEGAVATLTQAAEHHNAVSLWEPAAKILLDAQELDDAAAMATGAIAKNLPRAAARRLRMMLAEIAERRLDWREMESCARAVVNEFPQDTQAAWTVVVALFRQAKNQEAWAFLTAHELEPFNETTAQIAIIVFDGIDAPHRDAGPVLEIARMFTVSEHVTALAISTLMTSGDHIRFSEEQQSQLREITDDFFARFPDSGMLWSYSAVDPEELLRNLGDLTKDQAVALEPMVEQVRYGRLPYGVLHGASGLPYADLLLSVAAGSITAISGDSERRDRERRAAAAAFGNEVAVDTSVVATAILAELDPNHLAQVFQSVLVGEELIIDARLAVQKARQPVSGRSTYDPLLGHAAVSPVDEQQLGATRERARRALNTLEGWQTVNSGPLASPDGLQEHSLRPWDASIRVAINRQCAFWCDDIALRDLAKSVGIPTFGTWALYESLISTPAGTLLPNPLEVKAQFLRARIADVPIGLPDLAKAADESEFSDNVVCGYLSRPLAWARDTSATLEWFLNAVGMLTAQSQSQRVALLLHAGSYGLGAAVDTSRRSSAIGALLAGTIRRVADPAVVPILLASSRLAAADLNPADEPDPLQHAVRHLLIPLEDEIGPSPAARTVIHTFSHVDAPDRHTVTTLIIGDR